MSKPYPRGTAGRSLQRDARKLARETGITYTQARERLQDVAVVQPSSEREDLAALAREALALRTQHERPAGLAIASFTDDSGDLNTRWTVALARMLQQENERRREGLLVRPLRVLILDGDLSWGNLGFTLTQQQITTSILDLLEDPLVRIEDVVIPFEGLDILPAPAAVNMYDHPQRPENYVRLLERLRQVYDVILIDCGKDVISDWQEAWLGHADQVLLFPWGSYAAYPVAQDRLAYMLGLPRPITRQPTRERPIVAAEKLRVIVTDAVDERVTALVPEGAEVAVDYHPTLAGVLARALRDHRGTSLT